MAKKRCQGGRTITSRTVMLSSSMALWIISSWNSGDLPELAAGSDDQFEFVRRMHGTAPASGLCAEGSQQPDRPTVA